MQAVDRKSSPARRAGLRLAWLALALNFLGPFAYPVAPDAGASGGNTVEICTDQGIRTITLDDEGQPRPASRAGASCLFCLPLLKLGGAGPVEAPEIAAVAIHETIVVYVDSTKNLCRVPLRHVHAPRAPPIA